MKNIMNKTKYTLLVLFSAALVLSSCRTRGTSDLVAKTKMQKVKTAAKLNDLLEQSKDNLERGWENLATDAVPTPEADGSESTSGSREHSTTNVQVEGVDEGDVIKTDGDQVFYAPRYSDTFYVFDVDAEYDITVKKEIVQPGFYVESLYLTRDYVITLNYGAFHYGPFEPVTDPPQSDSDDVEIVVPAPAFSGSKIALYERENFTVSYEIEFNFYVSNHRLINDSLFFVGDRYIYGADIVPLHRENSGDVISSSYDDMYYFEDSYVDSLTVVGGLLLNKDVANIKYNEKVYLTSYIYLRDIYVSHENLYILSGNYVNERERSYQTTTISQHKLNVSAASTSFVAASNVPGLTLNQFAVDEYDGYLRIATTDTQGSWRVNALGYYDWESYKTEVTNYLFILKAEINTAGFSLVGYIDEGLGKPGETIKSVRFEGEKALIVTFLQTDPLYVINLNDPANPVITDAIELPGYDVYQHNWGSNKVLGFGYNATETGIINGMKLTAYDVTEGSARELETYSIYDMYDDGHSVWTYGYSEALYNHRAMLVHVGKGLFGFPLHYYATTMTNDNHYVYEYSSAYYLFKINFAGGGPIISAPIKVEHERASEEYSYVDRAVMIDDYLYTFSSYGVVVLDLISEHIIDTLEL